MTRVLGDYDRSIIGIPINQAVLYWKTEFWTLLKRPPDEYVSHHKFMNKPWIDIENKLSIKVMIHNPRYQELLPFFPSIFRITNPWMGLTHSNVHSNTLLITAWGFHPIHSKPTSYSKWRFPTMGVSQISQISPNHLAWLVVSNMNGWFSISYMGWSFPLTHIFQDVFLTANQSLNHF